MAKLLKHLGWGVKKSNHQVSSGRSECNNSTQKSNSVHELMPKSPNRYQSNVCLTSGNVAAIANSSGDPNTPAANCTITSARSEYDTRSLKLNLDGSKPQQDNDKHHYQSLQKGTSGSAKGRNDGLKSPGSSSNLGSIESPEGTSSSESAVMPMIADEYCDPLDLTETGSLMVDDDYSIPYDEVNKVLKDIQTNKAEKLLNGITSNIIPVDKDNSSDGQPMAKVPLKLTSSSQVTSLRIKPRRIKEPRKQQIKESKIDSSCGDKNEGNKPTSSGKCDEDNGQCRGNREVNVFSGSSGAPSTVEGNDLLVVREIVGNSSEGDMGAPAGHLYSSNCTSGGCVTVVSTNDFSDFEPIDCGDMLTSLSISQSGDVPDVASGSEERSRVDSIDGKEPAPEMGSKSDQSSQTFRSKCDCPNVEREGHHVCSQNLGRARPKSDGILLFSPKESKKMRLKNIQNGKRMDSKAVQDLPVCCCECQCEGLNFCCQTSVNVNYHGNKTLHKDSRCKDGGDLRSTSAVKTYLNLPLQQQSWFHGRMGRFDAERLLDGRSEGTFLVRISESNNEDFSLSLKSSAGFLHIKIVQKHVEDGHRKFILGQFSQPFESVASMVKFYQDNKLPVRGSESLFLLHPLLVGAS